MAVPNVKWSDIALQRIYEIADYIAKDAPHAAIKWTEELFRQEAVIQKLPYVGRMVPEIRDENIREILVGNYRLVYKICGKEIHILTVKSQRQENENDDYVDIFKTDWFKKFRAKEKAGNSR